MKCITRVISSRKMRWAGNVVHMGDMRKYTKFWSKDLGRPRHRCKDNIRVNLHEVSYLLAATRHTKVLYGDWSKTHLEIMNDIFLSVHIYECPCL